MFGNHLSTILSMILIAMMRVECQEESAKNHKNCKTILHELAAGQKDFLQCATLHSVPVGLCIGCDEQYAEMIVAYNLLASNCSDIYFNKDHVNIVATTESILEGLWTKAYCDDCFKSNNSYVFNEKKEALDACFMKNQTVCETCLTLYTELNEFYISMDQSNNGQICYDLQDDMNRTRSIWSKDFKCCRREFKIVYFVIAASISITMVALFYGGAFGLSKYRERNHSILNEGPAFESPLSIPRPQNSAAANNLQRSQTQQPAQLPQIQQRPQTSATNKKYAALQEDSDSDDDSILPAMERGKKLE